MTTILIGLLIPLLGTILGASFVFFMKRDMPEGMAVGVVFAGTHSNLSTIGFAIGFVLMMVLDVVMG